MAARVTLKAINDELNRRGHNTRLEKANCHSTGAGAAEDRHSSASEQPFRGSAVLLVAEESWVLVRGRGSVNNLPVNVERH
jgi:hypothetical protein